MRRIILVISLFIISSCTLIPNDTPTPGPSPTLPDPQVTTISAPDAEGLVKAFLAAWDERQFDSMYDMLSPLTKDSISRVAFLERYEDVGTALSLIGVEGEIVSSLINPQSAQVRYRIKLKSAILGDINRETWMDLTRVEDEWKVAWRSETILPELSEENKLLLAPVVPTRANIYDREGLALAAQSDTVALYLVPNEIPKDAEAGMLSTLSRLLNLPQGNILSRYDDIRQYDWYVHLGEVSLSEFQPFENALLSAEAVYWKTYPSRYYFSEGLAPHSVGYVGLISAEEVEDYQRLGYLGDEFVGKIGLESVYEDTLRGNPGGTLYLTDSEGQLEKALVDRASEAPSAIYSTIDRDLQLQAQKAMYGLVGAIVVLERDTGAVLAMVSSPGFDPNFFNPSHPYSGGGLEEIFGDTDRPLFNRATHGLYPLGSTFKIITMAAALESGLYEPGTIYNCGLEFRELPGVVLYDWRYERDLPGQGEISLTQGLVRSCNPYFYHIGLDLYNHDMPTALPDMARSFGLGEPTGIEIGDEAGLVPDPESKMAQLEEEWGPQDAVSLAIGQSFMQATPLQLARYVAAIGNGGTLYRPQLVDRIQSPDGEVIHEFQPEAQSELPISEETLSAIQEAMVQVVRGEKGTARLKLLSLNLDIAGKTGTATTGDFSESHAWFSGYSFEEREDMPDIAVAVIVEYAGEGSEWAVPVFRRVMESYFFGQPFTPYPWEERIGVWKTETPTPTPGPEDVEGGGTPVPDA